MPYPSPSSLLHFSFSVKPKDSLHQKKQADLVQCSRFTFWRNLRSLLRRLFSKTSQLFQAPHSVNNAVMLVIFATISFGYYGMWLWMPELFAMAEKDGRAPCSLRLSHGHDDGEWTTVTPQHSTMASSVNSSTNACVASSETYRDSLLSTIATLPGNLVSIFCVDRLGRKPLLVISMIVSGKEKETG